MLALEPLIRQRLADLPGLVGGVGSIAELSAEATAGRRFPAVYVGAMGHRVEDAGQPSAMRVASRWMVVLAVRQAADARGGSAAAAAAADLLPLIMARLYRWQPDGYMPLLPIDAPQPEYAAGVLLYPTAWEAVTIIRKE